jgi:hypothetical protein
MTTTNNVCETIQNHLNMKGSYFDEVYIPISINEIKASYYSSKPSGAFSINIGFSGSHGGKLLVRTDKTGYLSKDKLDKIKQFVTNYANAENTAKALREKLNNVKEANRELAADIRAEFANNVGNSSYCNTYVIPSQSNIGKVVVQYNFGEVDKETALKIANFIKTL